MRSAIRVCHKYLALCLACLWLVQAVSGMLLVFHRSIDDRLLGASGQAVNLQVVDEALARIGERLPDADILEYFVSGGIEGQVDVLIERAGAGREVVRIDGATGEILRISAWQKPVSQLAGFRCVLLIHKQLLGGKLGEWLIGLSGVLLAVNILLGLRMAWPKAGRWRAALSPGSARGPAANAYAWHRALGLCLAPFALLIALTGSVLTWSQELPGVSEARMVAPAPLSRARAVPGDQRPAHQRRAIYPSAAVAAALRLYPGASLAVVSMPNARRAWYEIRLRQSAELRRVYGTTLVRVDAESGNVLTSVDALRISLADRVLAALYPIHSGEWGGLPTRLLALAVGSWLIATMVFGVALWARRRGARRQSRGLLRPAADPARS